MELLLYRGSIEYGANDLLSDIDISISRGMYCAFLYNQDIYKDFLKYLIGLRDGFNGSIQFRGEELDPETFKRQKLFPDISFMPRKGGYNPDYTGQELFAFMSDYYVKFDMNKAIETAGLFKLDIHKKLKTLPEYRQRLLLMAALFASDSLLFFLEEPLTDFPAGMIEKMQTFFLKEGEIGRTIIITEKEDTQKLLEADDIYHITYKGIEKVYREEEKEEEKEESVVEEKSILINDNIELNDSKDEKTADIDKKDIKLNKKIRKIAVQDDEKIILIDYGRILWISTHKGECTIHTTEKDYSIKKLLKDLEEELISPPFFRCHRGYIVNMEKVEEVSTWFNGTYNLKIEGEEIPVSRSKAEELKVLLGL